MVGHPLPLSLHAVNTHRNPSPIRVPALMAAVFLLGDMGHRMRSPRVPRIP
ncbi:hypothetical protein Hanom_Chr12g01181721 [Helianthus anomalus]